MSKWADDFIEQYKETGTVKKLTEEIKKATHLKFIDQKLSEVIKGKWKRRSKK